MPRFLPPSANPTTLRGRTIRGARPASIPLLLALSCFARPAFAAGDARTTGDQQATLDAGERQPSGGESDGGRARALELFEQSSALYDQGDFPGAVALLQSAYAAFPEPILLYNLGRTYEGLGDDATAIASYEKYLAAQPDAKDAGAIRRRLQTLRERVKAQSLPAASAAMRAPQPATAAPASPSHTVEPRTTPQLVAPWIVTGVGVLGLAGGTVLWSLSADRHERAKDDSDVVSAQQAQSAAQSLARGATIALVAGSIVAAAGATWAIVALTSSRPAASSAPRVALGLGTISISGRL